MSTIIGIDPGKSGAIAFLSEDGARVETLPWLLNELDWDRFDFSKVTKAYIERPTPLPHNGSKAAFTSGYCYGQITAFLRMSKIPYVEISPVTWTRKLFGSQTNKGKEASLAFCAKTFPDVSLIPKGKRKPQDGLADALCIAEYGRRYC